MIRTKLLNLFGAASEPMVGIDIGSSAIKLLHIENVNDQYYVKNYATEPLEPGIVVEKAIKEPASVAKALKKLLQKVNTQEVTACISVPNSQAITKIIQVASDLDERAIQDEIDLEADRYIPYALEEVNLDFTVLGPSEKSADLVDVLLSVSKTENVDHRVQLLSHAGLSTKIVDIDSFAMERVFSLIFPRLPQQKDMVVAMIDIGATITTLHLFQYGKSIYTRDQSFGGQHLLDELQLRYGLSNEEILLAREQDTLPDDYIVEVLQPFKETIVKQVSRSCQFFFSAGAQNEIHYLLLAGGTSNIPGLDELISKEIGIKTAIANPFVDMMLYPDINEKELMDNAASLMTCCGLALRNCEKKQ